MKSCWFHILGVLAGEGVGESSWPLHVSILYPWGALTVPWALYIPGEVSPQELGGEGVRARAGWTRNLGARLEQALTAFPEEGCHCLSGALVRNPSYLVTQNKPGCAA